MFLPKRIIRYNLEIGCFSWFSEAFWIANIHDANISGLKFIKFTRSTKFHEFWSTLTRQSQLLKLVDDIVEARLEQLEYRSSSKFEPPVHRGTSLWMRPLFLAYAIKCNGHWYALFDCIEQSRGPRFLQLHTSSPHVVPNGNFERYSPWVWRVHHTMFFATQWWLDGYSVISKFHRKKRLYEKGGGSPLLQRVEIHWSDYWYGR